MGSSRFLKQKGNPDDDDDDGIEEAKNEGVNLNLLKEINLSSS